MKPIFRFSEKLRCSRLFQVVLRCFTTVYGWFSCFRWLRYFSFVSCVFKIVVVAALRSVCLGCSDQFRSFRSCLGGLGCFRWFLFVFRCVRLLKKSLRCFGLCFGCVRLFLVVSGCVMFFEVVKSGFSTF